MTSTGFNFVYIHMPLPDRAGNWGYEYNTSRILRSSNLSKIKEISNNHTNSVFFCGHTHDAWELQGINHTSNEKASTLSTSGEITNTSRGDNYDANVYPTSNNGRTTAWHFHIPACFKVNYRTNESGLTDKG